MQGSLVKKYFKAIVAFNKTKTKTNKACFLEVPHWRPATVPTYSATIKTNKSDLAW